jgi:hypothetical protein
VTVNDVPEIGGNTATVDSDQMDQEQVGPILPPGGGVIVPLTDLQVTMELQQQLYQVTYTVVYTNAGPKDVVGAPVTAQFPVLMGTSWSCVGANGGVCSANTGTGNIAGTVTLPVNGTVTYTVQGMLQNQLSEVNAVATIATPSGIDDSNLLNNVAELIRYRLVLPVIWKQ